MDLQLLDALPSRPMNESETKLAQDFYAAIQRASNHSARSIQASAHRIGVSDLGFCSERVRRHLAGQQEPEMDKTAAFIGTALGDHVEQAVTDVFPDMIRQAEVSITLTGDTGTYQVLGHPDLIDPKGVLIDVKTIRGLGRISRTGPDQQKQFQRHCYAKAAHEAGLFDDGVALENVQVANIWFDRAGVDKDPYVHMEPYDPRVVDMATMWLDDVVYAWQADEPARKEPPVQMCFAACGFAPDCRIGDSFTGLITDQEQLAAIAEYREALELEKRAKKMKDEAKTALTNVAGSTGEYVVKWVKVGSSHVEFDRPAYERLDIRPLRRS